MKVKAGRELDRMIAEKVFGRDPLTARQGLHADGDIEYHWGYPLGHDLAPAYSSDLNAAWTVVELMTDHKRLGGELIGGIPVNTRFYYAFPDSDVLFGNAREAATSICLLALQTLGVDVELEEEEDQ